MLRRIATIASPAQLKASGPPRIPRDDPFTCSQIPSSVLRCFRYSVLKFAGEMNVNNQRLGNR